MIFLNIKLAISIHGSQIAVVFTTGDGVAGAAEDIAHAIALCILFKYADTHTYLSRQIFDEGKGMIITIDTKGAGLLGKELGIVQLGRLIRVKAGIVCPVLV